MFIRSDNLFLRPAWPEDRANICRAGVPSASDPLRAGELKHGLLVTMPAIGNDRIAGGSGDDRLVVVGGDDYLAGNDGDDRLEGRGGDDTLRGAAGNDTLIGGAGADSFIFGPGGGVDRVADFDPIEDRVMIARSAIGTSDANFISDAIRETAGGVIVELLDADRIVFVGESLSAQDMTNAIYLV